MKSGFYNGQRLEVVPFQSYLGVMFSWTGNWFQAQKALNEQANRGLHSLIRSIHRYGSLPANVALQIFDGKILPILLYGSEVWGFHPSNDIEKIHNKMLRYVLQLYKNTPIVALRGESGRTTLKVHRY